MKLIHSAIKNLKSIHTILLRPKNSIELQPWLATPLDFRWNKITVQLQLKRTINAKFGKRCYVAPKANILSNEFSLGSDSYIAYGAIIRDVTEIGCNSSINAYTHIAGNVKIGNGVRIAGGAGIYGFNHGFSRVDIPIFRQSNTSKGIVLSDDVWVGANAIITDGCTIGRGSIIGAGAVVVSDIPEFTIAGGNPAKIIRSRK